MLASTGHTVPAGADWTFEPKYDGIRVLAFADADGVALVTRNGIDKARQFPEIVSAIRALVADRRRPFILDGEIVAREGDGWGRFQALQGRIHLGDERLVADATDRSPVALVALDLLAEGADSLVADSWTTRRVLLERLLAGSDNAALELGESYPNDGEHLMRRARREGWEGIIAKRMDAPYRPGERSLDWRKLKIEGRQELVVGGWTEPRNSREHIGALLLGYFADGALVYAGHTGGGFSRAALADMHRRLSPLEREQSPFAVPPRTNEKAHWTVPELVVEVKFNQWTDDGRLRQPIFLGVREDKRARDVRREETMMPGRAASEQEESTPSRGAKAPAKARANADASKRAAATGRTPPAAARGRETVDPNESPSAARTGKTVSTGIAPRGVSRRASAPNVPPQAGGAIPRTGTVGRRLAAIEAAGGDGALDLGGGQSLEVSSLGKVYFPHSGFTKGDVMAYYAAVAPAILPALEGRALVLKRFPDGIAGNSFFQQNASEHTPAVVRVEELRTDAGREAERLVGGDLATLLYCVQLGAIEMHPWHSRVDSVGEADYAVLDLDPGADVPFSRVVQVARWIEEELNAAGLHGALKTSGSRGLHVVLPLSPRTSYESSLILTELIATRVATAHPKEATVERSLKRRARGTVYVDYMQNGEGKSVAAPFSVRAREPGKVSTPLEWRELTDDLDPDAFTMASVPSMMKVRRAIWTRAMRRLNDLRRMQLA